MQLLVDFLKALSDPTRLKIAKLLSTEELAVCEIAYVMNVSQPTVSQHLRKLERLGLVKERKDGLVRYCSLNSQMLQELMGRLQGFLQLDDPVLDGMQDELARLQDVKQSDPLQMCKSSNCCK